MVIGMSLAMIDPWSLPKVLFEHRDSLPDSRGLYFVFEREDLVYIGKSSSFRTRWRQHHRAYQLEKMKSVCIAFWEIDLSDEDLMLLEGAAISQFQPKLNWAKVEKDSSPMVEIKFSVPPVLAEQALALSQSEGLKLSEIYRQCWIAGLSQVASRNNTFLLNQQLLKGEKKTEKLEAALAHLEAYLRE